MTPREWTLRRCYEFSKGALEKPLTRARFFEALARFDCERFARLVQADLDRPPAGELCTLARLRAYARADAPSLETILSDPAPSEQTLQWLLVRRGYLQTKSERIVARELPVSSADERRGGSVDLLVVDEETQQPTLVELKRAEADDSLTGVLLEVLSHWAFHMRHQRAFVTQLANDGLVAPESMPIPQVAIAAPEAYFAETVRRSHDPRRHSEVRVAGRIIACVRGHFGVRVRLLAIANDWQRQGLGLAVADWQIPDA